jgi:hypothetical protein
LTASGHGEQSVITIPEVSRRDTSFGRVHSAVPKSLCRVPSRSTFSIPKCPGDSLSGGVLHPTSSPCLCGSPCNHEIIPSSNILQAAFCCTSSPEDLKTSRPLAAVHFVRRFRNLPKQDHGGRRKVFLQPFNAFHLTPSGQCNPMFLCACFPFQRI